MIPKATGPRNRVGGVSIETPPPTDAAGPVSRLQALIRIPTVSHIDESETEWAHFTRLIDLLPGLYPLTHEHLERELVAGHSMLYHWRGREEGLVSVLMAHYDVVAASDEGWRHPPFGAELVGDGDAQVVWGRGTLDDKGSMVAIL